MSKTKCSNCDKDIDSNIFFLHERFCSINVRKCSICNEPIQKDEYEEHKLLDHPNPKCKFCHLTFSSFFSKLCLSFLIFLLLSSFFLRLIIS